VRAALAPKTDEKGQPMKWAAVCADAATGLSPGDPLFLAWIRLAGHARARDQGGGLRAARARRPRAAARRPRPGRGRSAGPAVAAVGGGGGGSAARRRRARRPRGPRAARHGEGPRGAQDGKIGVSVRFVTDDSDARKERDRKKKEEREAKRKAERARLERLGY
jgi:hypothetical protein